MLATMCRLNHGLVSKRWVRSLKGNATPRRALTSSASLARGKKQLREAKRSASIRSMRRWVWPIADANRALKAAIRGSAAKVTTVTLGYEAFEARHCMRRLTPATLGVHLRESVRDEQEQAASRILVNAMNVSSGSGKVGLTSNILPNWWPNRFPSRSQCHAIPRQA